jgi:lipopolysaccharide/colanic/teichoic acid biosynthesis glycosyltransferase
MSPFLSARLVVDRAVAALLLLLSAPVLAVLGVLVRRHDGGPALIAVPRIGRDGREIPMWKLRSMRAETSDGRATGVALTRAGDDRITPIGRRLRALHLDELPQLLNVVRGEMALLGPRPEAPEFVDPDDPTWRAVLAAPPGIAGPTQLVVGDWEVDVISAAPDGTAYRDEVLPVKLAIDRWYVERATPVVDLLVVVGVLQRVTGRVPTGLLRRVRAEVPEAAVVPPPVDARSPEALPRYARPVMEGPR